MRPALLVDPLLLTAPTNASRLSVYELERARVLKPHAPIPFDTRIGYRGNVATPIHPVLDVPHWSFLHAWAKTRFQCTITERQIEEVALSQRVLSELALAWQPANLRVRDHNVFALKDASEAIFSSGAAEACASLFMMSRGYLRWDHVPSLINRRLHKQCAHPERTRRARAIAGKVGVKFPAKEPDFLFEKANGESALMESKGLLPNPGERATVKTRLREALTQLAGWSRFILPTPAKAFGVATVLRELSDDVDSHIAFVDPEGGPPDEGNAAFLPADWLRRGSYGSWLVGMGLIEAGEALRWGRSKERGETQLPVIRLGGRSFAFSGQIAADWRLPPSLRYLLFEEIWPLDFVFILGIDTQVLGKLSTAIRDGERVIEVDPLPEEPVRDPQWKGSVFRDGTAFGVLRRPFAHDVITLETFNL